MVNLSKALIKCFVPRSSKFILKGATFDQYDALTRIICSSRPADLKNHLSFMSTSEAGELVNLKNIKGATLLMQAVYYSKNIFC
jgi:hypothetical protein